MICKDASGLVLSTLPPSAHRLVPEEKTQQITFIPSLKKPNPWLARVYTKTRRENSLYHLISALLSY